MASEWGLAISRRGEAGVAELGAQLGGREEKVRVGGRAAPVRLGMLGGPGSSGTGRAHGSSCGTRYARLHRAAVAGGRDVSGGGLGIVGPISGQQWDATCGAGRRRARSPGAH